LESKEKKGEASPEDLSLKANLAEKISIRNESLMPVQMPISKTITRRVYIHINDEAQREPMKALQTTLARMGFRTPGIENITGKAQVPENTNVRYFNEQDAEQAGVVVDELKALGFTTATSYRLIGANAPAGSLEVWLSKQ
jgi:phosphate starvation-inducible protein PhoH